jgi:hypothetical protein
MSVHNRQLAGNQRRAPAVAIIDEFQQIQAFGMS